MDDKLVKHGASPDKNKVVGLVAELTNVEAQDRALAAIGTVEWIHISCPAPSVSDGWRIVLAENLVAASKGTDTRIAFAVNDPGDVFGLSKAMELGVDALSVAADAPDYVWDTVVEARNKEKSGGTKDKRIPDDSTTTGGFSAQDSRTERSSGRTPRTTMGGDAPNAAVNSGIENEFGGIPRRKIEDDTVAGFSMGPNGTGSPRAENKPNYGIPREKNKDEGDSSTSEGKQRTETGDDAASDLSPPEAAPKTTIPTSFPPLELWIDVRSSSPSSSARFSEADAILSLGVYEAAEAADKRTFTQRQEDGKDLYHRSNVAGMIVDLSDAKARDSALSAVGSVEWIHVSCPSAGLEDASQAILDLVAASRETRTRIAFDVSEDDFELSKALEMGVDALSVGAHAPGVLWDAAIEARAERNKGYRSTGKDIEAAEVDAWNAAIDARAEKNKKGGTTAKDMDDDAWVDERAKRSQGGGATPATADSSKPAGLVLAQSNRLTSPGSVLADRVCVDLVRTLSPTEGCWIGSSTNILALVLSEATPSPYAPTRPFRVNAGPIHSYILLGDGETTKYLFELNPGDEVLVYDAETGESRPVAVGRLKIEARPCVLVGLDGPYDEEDEDKELGRLKTKGQLFLQQVETVRLGKRGGTHVRITDLKDNDDNDEEKQLGEEILIQLVGSGTHVGRAYGFKAP